MTTALLIDLLLAGLLVATIVYAVILNRRLGAFRQGKEELRALIVEFNAATERARVGMDELREASEGMGQSLHATLGEARALRDDLGFLVERGAVVADRLVHDVRARREPAPAAKPAANDPADSLRKILESTR
jgi:hypothetical protein